MIIAHLPAGYIFSKLLTRKLADKDFDLRLITAACLLGAITPDLDMVYFYLIDNRQHHHHSYWSHYPIVWISLLLLFTLWFRRSSKQIAFSGIIFSSAAFIHLLLDTIAGDIRWLAPFVNESFSIFVIPSTHNTWWLNFLLHWSFSLEILITIWAAYLFSQRNNCVTTHRLPLSSPSKAAIR